MLSPEPRRGRWELHWRMFGADMRVQLLFWVSCALVGAVYYQDPNIRNDLGAFPAFLLWVGVALTSVLAHEAGHVLAARLFGCPLRIVISGLGGQLYGFDALRLWQKVILYLTGPLMNGGVFGAVWAILDLPLPVPLDWRIALAPTLERLLWVNAFWALLNLLPLWPLDGGHIAVEIGVALLGRRGRTLALLLSLVITVLLILFVLAWMRLSLFNPYDPHYTIFFIYFCIQSLYCYAFWISTFRALWDNAEPSNSSADSDRAA